MRFRIASVKLAEFRVVSAMQCADSGCINKARAGQTLGGLQVDEIAISSRVLDSPGCVMQLL